MRRSKLQERTFEKNQKKFKYFFSVEDIADRLVRELLTHEKWHRKNILHVAMHCTFYAINHQNLNFVFFSFLQLHKFLKRNTFLLFFAEI